MSNADPLDKELLSELREIMEDEFPSLIETFLVESEKQYLAVQGAWQAQDLDELRREAHALKGSCGNVGALALNSLCADIERKAHEGETAGIEEMLQETGGQLQTVYRALNNLV